MPTYTEIIRPSVPTYTEIERYDGYIDNEYLFQDGQQFLFQDSVEFIFENVFVDIYTEITRPSVPTYTEIVKPT